MQVPGYEMDGPIGFGADGATWLAREPGGAAVAVRVLEPVDDDRHRARLRRLEMLSGLEDRHLAGLREVVATGATQVAVVSEAVPGPTLATVRVGRGGLGTSEVIGVGTALASALIALHRTGLAHGDLAPANVVLNPGRGAVLVDLAGEPAWESGTGGFAAPELSTGSPATPASDVYALAKLLLWLVRDAGRADLAQVLDPAVAADPDRRCDATRLYQVLSAHHQAPVDLPDLRQLAGVSLREHAQRDATRRKGSTRPRHRREPNRRPLLVVALLAALALIGTTAWVWPGLSFPGADGEADQPGTVTSGPAPAAPDDDDPVGGAQHRRDPGTHPGGAHSGPAGAGGGLITRQHGASDPIGAVHALTRARDTALNEGDGPGLLALTVPGSPAAEADAQIAAHLERGTVDVRGLRTEVLRASAEPDGTIRADLRSHEHTRRTGDGEERIPVADTCVRLHLVHQERWLVQQVHTC